MATATNPSAIHARKAGFFFDMYAMSRRGVRLMLRDLETVVTALLIPVFMYVLTVGALQDFAENIPGMDYRAFQLPVAVLFAVTGVSRAITVVTDIQSGYFDRLVITPVNRVALLLGLMVADFILIVALTIPVVIMGFIMGVTFQTGLPGILAFMLLAGLWGLVFNGFPYTIAFKTGNVTAVNLSWMLFFPALFMTTLFIPQEQMTPWLSTAADFNPVTYILAAERSLITEGWRLTALRDGLLATLGVGVVSLSLALAALRGRATRR